MAKGYKNCPNCHKAIGASSVSCKHCGYSFRKRRVYEEWPNPNSQPVAVASDIKQAIVNEIANRIMQHLFK